MAVAAAPSPPVPAGAVSAMASSEEVEKFIADNSRWLDDAASAEIRRLPPADQRRVLAGGAILNCRDALGVIRARIRQSKDREALLAGGPPPAADSLAAALQGSMLASPATKEEVEAFIRTNVRWLSGEAEDIFRAMNPIDQKRVISAGTMSGCRDPIAVLQTRAKRAREMELEFDMLTKGKQGQVSVPDIPVPKFSAEFGMAYALAEPEVVTQGESRFAPPPVPAAGPVEEEEPSAAVAGDVRGVGGVVEILKPKYGCARGQRFKVVGETSSLIQMEGGKTAPRNHEGSGWRWVLKSEEDNKAKDVADKEATKAKEEARRLEIEKVLKARQEKLALEKEERERQKEKRQLEKELAAKEEKEKPKEKEPKEKVEADMDGEKKEKDGDKAKHKKSTADKDKKQSKESNGETKTAKSSSKDKPSQKSKAKEEDKAKARKRRRGSSSSASPSESSSARKRKRSRAEGKEGKKGKQSKRKKQESSKSSRDSSPSPPAKGKKKKSARS